MKSTHHTFLTQQSPVNSVVKSCQAACAVVAIAVLSHNSFADTATTTMATEESASTATITKEVTDAMSTTTVSGESANKTPEADVPQYTISDEGKVDKGTFNGWRRFHGTCHACHGQDALGSSFAPNLTDSLKTIDYDLFMKTIMEGRQVTAADGSVSAMPSFANDKNITKHADDIYRYLKARAVGGLAPGRPKK